MSQIAGMFSDTLPAGVETNGTLKERDHLHGRVYSERSASQNYHRKLPKRSIEEKKVPLEFLAGASHIQTDRTT